MSPRNSKRFEVATAPRTNPNSGLLGGRFPDEFQCSKLQTRQVCQEDVQTLLLTCPKAIGPDLTLLVSRFLDHVSSWPQKESHLCWATEVFVLVYSNLPSRELKHLAWPCVNSTKTLPSTNSLDPQRNASCFLPLTPVCIYL